MMTKSVLVMLVATVLCFPVFGQSLRILKGKQITESALIEALSPAPGGVLTRSIHPDAATTPAQKPAAALLITFQTNSTALTPQARRELSIVGQALNNLRLVNFDFIIEGHADPRGSPESNLALSKERAEAVRNYLVENEHVRAARLSPVGKGDLEPLNLSNPAAPENRRVTFVNVSQ